MSRVLQRWLPWGTVVLLLVILGSGVVSAQTASGVINACKENRTGVLSAVPNKLITTTTCPVGTTPLSWNSRVVTQALDLISEATTINNFIDIGAQGPSPGDTYAFSDTLYPAYAPAQPIGRADGHCTLIDPSVARFACTITSSLPAGNITTEGTLIFVPGSTNVGAVTGGTGTYRSAQGEARLVLGSVVGQPGARHQVTFSLLLMP